MPMNMDLLFFTFLLFFYGYGVYLHWGFEVEYVCCCRDGSRLRWLFMILW
jgi:hypothetical protein